MADCLYVNEQCSHPECRAYPGPVGEQSQPEPTIEEYCDPHPYYGDDGEIGRCYCGEKTYPKGG